MQSAPFNEEKGSFLWLLAPIALISSLILPQFFFANAIEAFLEDMLLVGICTSAIFVLLYELIFDSFILLKTDYIMFYVSRFNDEL